MRGPLAFALALSLAACAPDPFEFADWTIPVPEGTRIIEYAYVPLEERTERIELVEDLVIKQRDGDPNYSFYGPQELAVDESGRIYVLDNGNHRVQVFDLAGGYVRTLGREGEGPGELQLPIGIAIAGNRVVVHDILSRRISVWGVDGQHVGEYRISSGTPFEPMTGVSDDAFVTRLVGSDDRGSRDITARFSTDARELVRYLDLPFTPAPIMDHRISMALIFPFPCFTVSRDGFVYVTDSREYQVHAFDPSGTERWALRVAAPTQAIDETIRGQIVDVLRKRVPDLSPLGAEWPEYLPAADRAALNLDGHGRLYVFPFHWQSLGLGAPDLAEPGADSVPVDVYSPGGKRLFAGLVKRWTWKAARGDFLYGFRPDEVGEHEIVRYRVVEEF